MAHYDERKALRDPNPPPRPVKVYPPIRVNVEKLAMRVAAGTGRRPADEWADWERVYVERLLDHLEERHEPAEVDAVAIRFIEALGKALASSV